MRSGFEFNSRALREWLDKERRKQSYVTENLGIERASISRWLKGQMPQDDNLQALANLMGVEVSTLLLPKNKAKAG